MRRWAILWLAATFATGLCAPVGAQEIRRTELSRVPVSGDETREIITQLVEVPPGATSSRHFHNGEESYYILQGGTVRMPGKEPAERSAGEHGINRRGVPHAGYTVVGDRTIRIISVYVVDKAKPLQEPAP